MNKFGISILAGAAFLVGINAQAQAGGIYVPEGSMKDPMSAAVAVPAPMPIPDTTAWYVRGDVGYSSFDDPQIVETNVYTLSNSNIDDTWSVGGGFGYYFTHYLRGDITAEYIADAEVSGINSDTNATLGGGVREFDVHSAVALANVYVDFNRNGHFTPYIGAGIGVAWNDTSAGRAVDANGLTGVIEGASETNFAWALMAGVSAQIRTGLHIDANYRYLNLGEAHTGLIIPTGGGNTAGDPVIDELEVHQFRLGVRKDIW